MVVTHNNDCPAKCRPSERASSIQFTRNPLGQAAITRDSIGVYQNSLARTNDESLPSDLTDLFAVVVVVVVALYHHQSCLTRALTWSLFSSLVGQVERYKFDQHSDSSRAIRELTSMVATYWQPAIGCRPRKCNACNLYYWLVPS